MNVSSMKRYLFLIIVSLGLTSVMAQSLQTAAIPKVVQDKVKSMYPGSTIKKWEKEGNDYEAGLVESGVPTSVVLDSRGTVKEIESRIQPELLPKEAQMHIAAQHPGKPIAEAAKIVFPSGKVLYEAEIGGKDYLYDAAGAPVKGKAGSGGSGSETKGNGKKGSGEDGSGDDGSGGSGSQDGEK